MRDYKIIFENLSKQILDLSKNGTIDWKISRGITDVNTITASFIGDNMVEYNMSYKWEFSPPKGWELSAPHLRVTSPINISLYSFQYPEIKELGLFISNKYFSDFGPNDDEVYEHIKKISNGISIAGQRNDAIDKLIN